MSDPRSVKDLTLDWLWVDWYRTTFPQDDPLPAVKEMMRSAFLAGSMSVLAIADGAHLTPATLRALFCRLEAEGWQILRSDAAMEAGHG